MFESFEAVDVRIDDDVRIHARVGGAGPPLLLLHGYPQTHVMWHQVAPALAESFTVVAADLRGYGDSDKPASQPDHASYAKRAMARELVPRLREDLRRKDAEIRALRAAHEMPRAQPDPAEMGGA